jgi:hypothetical protein
VTLDSGVNTGMVFVVCTLQRLQPGHRWSVSGAPAGVVAPKRRRCSCYASTAASGSSDDGVDEERRFGQPPEQHAATPNGSPHGNAQPARPAPAVVRVQLMVLLETTAAWLAARRRGAPRASARELERVQRLPSFFRDTKGESSRSAPANAAVAAAPSAAGASSAQPSTTGPENWTIRAPVYRVVLFRAQTLEQGHSTEHVVRALVSHVPQMGFGTAVATARILERCGRAEVLMPSERLAECCCGRLLAEGIMASVEPVS